MPDIITRTIGATGDDATVPDWVTSSAGNLVTADEIRVGQLQSQSHALATSIDITGSTTDATHYLHLTGAVQHDPVADTGSRIEANPIINAIEDYTRISNFGYIRNGSGTNVQIVASGTNVLIDSLFMRYEGTGGQGGNGAINFTAAGDNGTVINCIICRDEALASTVGYADAVETSGDNTTISHNTIYNVRQQAIELNAALTGCVVQNNACFGNGVASGLDIDYGGNTGTFSFNLSSDASANSGNGVNGVLGDGTDFTYSGPDQIVTDATNNDFTVVASGPADNAGTDLTGTIPLDYFGNTRNNDATGHDIGASDNSVQPVLAGNAGTDAAAILRLTPARLRRF